MIPGHTSVTTSYLQSITIHMGTPDHVFFT